MITLALNKNDRLKTAGRAQRRTFSPFGRTPDGWSVTCSWQHFPGPFTTGTCGTLRPSVRERLSISTVISSTVTKTQLYERKMDFLRVWLVLPRFMRLPPPLIFFADLESIRFARLDRNIFGECHSAKMDKLHSPITQGKANWASIFQDYLRQSDPELQEIDRFV